MSAAASPSGEVTVEPLEAFVAVVMARSSSEVVVGGKVTARDRVGARVQERAGLVEVVADDEAAPPDLAEDEAAELAQVHDVGVLARRGQPFAELGEGHDR